MFVFSLKQPLMERLSQEYGDDAQALIALVWETDATVLRPAGLVHDRGVPEERARR